MSAVVTYQKAFKHNGQTHYMKELLTVSELHQPHVRCMRETDDGTQMFEWRAEARFYNIALKVMGMSGRIDAEPKLWYPVQDSEPMNTHMSANELLEAAVCAVRAELRAQHRRPEQTAPVEAVLVLLRMVRQEPDLIFADWVENALLKNELMPFVVEWEKDLHRATARRAAEVVLEVSARKKENLVRLSPSTVVHYVD